MTFADFLKKQGYGRVADILGVKEVAVRSMASRNYISKEHWPDLLLAVPELGLSDLRNMETQSKADVP